jgi:ribonucleoside-diphosphate reductase alpha chain
MAPAAFATQPANPIHPSQPISQEVVIEKYAKDDERSVDEVRRGGARALAAAEAPAMRAHWEALFLQGLRAGFLPAGRIQSAAGTDQSATLINCFVQPVGDSITHDDGHPGIYRPRGAWVGSTRSSASGPVSYMRMFDRSCETVKSETESFSTMPAHHARKRPLVVANARHSRAMSALCA